MPVGIVTGASRGLGLALAAPSSERGWRLVVDARDGDALRARRRRPRPASSRSPATSPTPRHRRALVAAAGARDRPARQQRERARPEPAAGARRLPARGARAGLRGQRRGAARARAAGAAAARARRGDRQRHLRRRRRGVRGLGRLRLVEGGARAADGDPRRRAARAARLRGRSRRHAHADAPGRVPGRGHLRPAAARGQRAGPAGADRGGAAERPLPRRTSSPRRRHERARASLRPSRRTSRPRLRGRGRDDVRDARREPARRRDRHARFGDLPRCSGRATCSSSTRRRRCPRPSTPRLGGREVELRLSTPAPGGRRPALGRRAAHRDEGRRPRVRRSRRVLELPGGARRRAARAGTPAATGSGWRGSTSASPLADYLAAARPRRSATATSRELAARRRTRRCSRATRAAPRCRAPGARSPPSSSPSSSSRGVLVAPITLHTGVSSPERASCRTPSATGCRRRPRASSTPRAAGAAA